MMLISNNQAPMVSISRICKREYVLAEILLSPGESLSAWLLHPS
ncbi:MAG TPA: hypothetical protein VNX87_22410 [Candidatus Sulfotelmatobacter sp.]|jgi:hypothetical protein|nr:hypothetical protein [Candidatus Sulfotelmatobacter sp.]